MPTVEDIPPPPELDPVAVTEGEVLYQAQCATCHGRDLSGHPDWMTPNEDGSFKPPPHDDSGHTWDHSDQLLLKIVRDGGDFSQTRMPTFGHLLDDDEILAILEFFKAGWGPEEREFQWRVTWQEQQRDR
ncbi:MAG: cytochrome c [Acidimicrobiia bacterium]|nr:cytochrome c [Acidimicrobiia bacterium]